MKINCDVAFDDLTKSVGIGLIGRSFTGSADGARCCRTKALDPEQAEAKALLEAALMARQKGYRYVHIEGDCLNVISALNDRSKAITWTTRNLITDYGNVLNSFDSWKCTHVLRDVNHVAHKLAKHGK
ncbi:uncharacterized protein LOC113305690 [Papaver somniferum]|uniref:uncharacterized protein LOC113305690 n=1 Tax=Papaver somniferum TaxID=3469 RepID=UPI000E6FB266|nr:uncharacterized protein LOC113305690 [Papaver somniferum]